MSKWNRYRSRKVVEMRPYVPGEPLAAIAIPLGETLQVGGMVARDPDHPGNFWYVGPRALEEKFEREAD